MGTLNFFTSMKKCHFSNYIKIFNILLTKSYKVYTVRELKIFVSGKRLKYFLTHNIISVLYKVEELTVGKNRVRLM